MLSVTVNNALLVLVVVVVVVVIVLYRVAQKILYALTLPNINRFLPARRYASAGLCDSDLSVCPSVCPSVRRAPVLCLAERKQDHEMYTI